MVGITLPPPNPFYTPIQGRLVFAALNLFAWVQVGYWIGLDRDLGGSQSERAKVPNEFRGLAWSKSGDYVGGAYGVQEVV